jgi:membrane protein DedA with SNARE-associated domain
MEHILQVIVDTISHLGYLGILIGMAIESSFIPFPSEIIMIPAGYLVAKGEMNLYVVILLGILGSLIGAAVNYFLAKKLAKPILVKYGKYFFISAKTIEKSEDFFKKHGEISTFTGRLIPGIRQIISLPAGAFGMPFFRFLVLTGLGAGIWIIILTILGVVIGQNEALLAKYLTYIKAGLSASVLLIVMLYITLQYKKTK